MRKRFWSTPENPFYMIVHEPFIFCGTGEVYSQTTYECPRRHVLLLLWAHEWGERSDYRLHTMPRLDLQISGMTWTYIYFSDSLPRCCYCHSLSSLTPSLAWPLLLSSQAAARVLYSKVANHLCAINTSKRLKVVLSPPGIRYARPPSLKLFEFPIIHLTKQTKTK